MKVEVEKEALITLLDEAEMNAGAIDFPDDYEEQLEEAIVAGYDALHAQG